MLDIQRHQSVFDPAKLTESVHVVGCGATGSRIALELAKLGIKDIHLWDDDVIEEHNIANQVYKLNNIGFSKSIVLSVIMENHSNIKSTHHDEKVTYQRLTGIVFLLVDTMTARKEIWENCIKFKPHVKLMIETRMGADSLRVYAINPLNFEHVSFWEGTLCEDDEAVASACGARTTVGATAAVISGLAVWELIKYQRSEFTGSELIVGLRPEPIMLQNKF